MPSPSALMIKLSRLASTSTVAVRRKETLTDQMQRVLSCARAFEGDYGVRFVDVGITPIVKNMTSAYFSAANSEATHIRFITVGKMIIKRQAVLLLPKKLGRGVSAAKALSITYCDDSGLYISYQKDIFLIVQTVHASFNKDHRPVPLHEN